MGADHVMWGTDSRVVRLAAVADRSACGGSRSPRTCRRNTAFAPLGDANSATKQLIFGGNAARLYRLKLKAADNTPDAGLFRGPAGQLKNEYELAAKEPSNLRYGYVRAA